jgi:hypothetical protein
MWILAFIYTLLTFVVIGLVGNSENAALLLAFCAVCIWVSYDYMQNLSMQSSVIPWKKLPWENIPREKITLIQVDADQVDADQADADQADADQTGESSGSDPASWIPDPTSQPNGDFVTSIARCEPDAVKPSLTDLSIVTEYNPDYHEHMAGLGDNLIFNRMKYTGTQERRAVEARSALGKHQHAAYLEDELEAESRQEWWAVDQLEK